MEKESNNILTKEELRQIHTYLKNESDFHYIATMLLMTTGVPKNDLFALRWQDVDFDDCVLTFYTKNTRIPYKRRIPKQLIEKMRDYQEVEKGVVFKNGVPTDATTINYFLKRFSKEHGLRKLTPLTFKMTYKYYEDHDVQDKLR